MSAQLVGVILAAIGGWLLWSPWSLFIAGLVLLVAPEVGELASRARRPSA